MTSPDTETPPEGEDAARGAAEGPIQGPVLTDAYTVEELDTIGKDIASDFDADVESCETYIKDCSDWAKLYEGVIERGTFPFDKAARVNVPMLTTAALQVLGRLYDMVLPAKGNVFNSVPLHEGPDELARANRTELRANYWARHECVEFNMTLEMLVFRMGFFGSAFSAEDWDENEGRPTYDCVPVEDFVVPWDARSTRPDMKDVPRYTWVRRMSFWDIENSMDTGFFRADEKVVPTEADDNGRMTQTRERISGLNRNDAATNKKDSLRKVLVHYRKLTLPDDPTRHASFDGKAHAVRVWVDHETSAVLRIVLREEPDPKDADRFQRETQAYQQYQISQAHYDATGGQVMDPMSGMPMALPKPQPVPEPKPQRIREVTFHTHYKAFPSEGFYGLGYGKIVGQLNRAMNTIVNQRLDLQTINNGGGGFKSSLIRFPNGVMNTQPGLWVTVDAPPGALKDGLIPRPMVPGDPTTPQMMEMLESWVQRATGSGDTLSGEPSKSNETATAATNRYDAAVKQISILASRVVQLYLKNDANMLWRLFATYLPDKDYTFIVDEQGNPQQLEISAKDFGVEGRVYPVADPRVITKQDRVTAAQQLLGLVGQHPMLAQNQQAQYYALRKYLVAMDEQEMLQMLKPPAPPPPIPQTDENAAFLKGQQPQVNPADDDAQHLNDIAVFKLSPEFKSMTPEQSNSLDQHARNHVAAKMEKDHKNAQQGQQGIPGMAPVGGNPGAGLASA